LIPFHSFASLQPFFSTMANFILVLKSGVAEIPLNY
jgi:hypothetical protein